MILIVSLIIGILFSSGLYLMLHKSFFKLIVGTTVYSYATVFFLFALGGLTKESPPLTGNKTEIVVAEVADPLPQALVLTAIVIGIGVQIFVMVLLRKVYEEVDTENLSDLNMTDRIDIPEEV